MQEVYPVYGERPEEDRYYIFGSRQNTPDETVLAETIYRFAYETGNIQIGATVALMYLTGSRIREITKYTYEGIARDEIKIEFRPLSLRDITIEHKNGYDWLVLQSRVEKIFVPKPNMTIDERRAQLSVERRKPEPTKIPLDERHPLYALAMLIIDYVIRITGPFDSIQRFNLNSVKYGHLPIWSQTPRSLQYNITKYFNIHPHLLRHWRCKHLVENYDYKTSNLMKVIGWKSSNMALYYSESSEKDLETKNLNRMVGR